MREGLVEEQEIRSKLGHGDGAAIDQQLNLYLGGVSAIIYD
jgi:hypothetical protein